MGIVPTKEIQSIFRCMVIMAPRYVCQTTNAIFMLIMLRNCHVSVPSMIDWVDLILHDTSNVTEAHQELFRNTRHYLNSQRNRKVRRTRTRKSQRNRKGTRTKFMIYMKTK